MDSCHACIEADSILWYTNLCELSHIPDIESVLVSTDHTNQLKFRLLHVLNTIKLETSYADSLEARYTMVNEGRKMFKANL